MPPPNAPSPVRTRILSAHPFTTSEELATLLTTLSTQYPGTHYIANFRRQSITNLLVIETTLPSGTNYIDFYLVNDMERVQVSTGPIDL
jgi:hypothetical protein